MASKIMMFDKYMRPLDELNAAVTPRSWVLNDVGRAEFSLSLSDPKCKEVNIQYGNLVLIQHVPSKDAAGNEKGRLPDWVGIILPKRDWDLGVVHVTAFSAESVLAFRPMPFTRIEGSPATMFKQILQYANDLPSGIKVQPGMIDDLPVILQDDLRISAHEHLKTVAQKARMDWDVTAELDDNGSLVLYANLYTVKGVNTLQGLDSANTELRSPLLSEQGVPFNYVVGYSHAFTETDRTRGEGINQASLDDYGLLGMNEVFLGLHDAGSVVTAANNRAISSGRPQKIIQRTALDSFALFDFLDVGNTLSVHDDNVGFSPDGGFGLHADVTVISLDYNDLTNKCPLNLEVVNAN